MVKRRESPSDAGLAADSRSDIDEDGRYARAVARDAASAAEGINRRSYLKLLGVSVLPAAATSVEASETGYGQDGYGEGGYGGDEEETVDPVVSVETDPATDITDASATLHGTVSELSGIESADVYFEYRDGSSSTWAATEAQQLTDTGSFSAAIDELESDTGYEYRAVAEADAASDAGETLTFSTDETSALSVATDAATNVSDTSATLNGTVTELTNIDAVDVRFEYREAGSSTWTTTDSQRLTAEESFSEDVAGLASEQTYEYRSVAESTEDTDTGKLLEFTTDEPELAEPVIDRFKARDTSPPNPHVELDVDWAVSHDDGALEVVRIIVRDDAGSVIDRAETAVSGFHASGSETFEIKHGAGETYYVTLIVTDQADQATEDEQILS